MNQVLATGVKSHFLRATATAIGLIAILAMTLAVFQLPVLNSLQLIVEGAAGDRFGWSRTIVKSTPLLLTGLGMTIAWRAGMFNIGGEGQFIVGALTGAVLAKTVATWLPSSGMTFTILVASIVGGAIWAAISGWLFLKRGVEVVISTILLNFIAFQILSWAVTGPLQEGKGELPLSDLLPESIMLTRLDRQMEMHSGSFIAVAAAVGLAVFLFLTPAGFRIRLVGQNARVARANRLDPDRTRFIAIAISGGFCGLAGGIEYVGVAGQLGTGFPQGWGFLGIPVALLGALHPLWVVPSALFFGMLFAGSENLARYTPAGTTLIYVIQAVVVLAVVLVRALSDRTSAPSEED